MRKGSLRYPSAHPVPKKKHRRSHRGLRQRATAGPALPHDALTQARPADQNAAQVAAAAAPPPQSVCRGPPGQAPAQPVGAAAWPMRHATPSQPVRGPGCGLAPPRVCALLRRPPRRLTHLPTPHLPTQCPAARPCSQSPPESQRAAPTGENCGMGSWGRVVQGCAGLTADHEATVAAHHDHGPGRSAAGGPLGVQLHPLVEGARGTCRQHDGCKVANNGPMGIKRRQAAIRIGGRRWGLGAEVRFPLSSAKAMRSNP